MISDWRLMNYDFRSWTLSSEPKTLGGARFKVLKENGSDCEALIPPDTLYS